MKQEQSSANTEAEAQALSEECVNIQDSRLCDSDRRLLQKYLDGECSSFTLFFARRLLRKSDDARRYLELLSKASAKVVESSLIKSAALKRESLSTEELWRRIEQRIDAEERASVLLGERKVRNKDFQLDAPRMRSFIESLSEGILARRSSVFGGMAALTTCCLLLVLSFSSGEPVNELDTVSLEGEGSSERKQYGMGKNETNALRAAPTGSTDRNANEIRILPFSRSVPIDFVSSRSDRTYQHGVVAPLDSDAHTGAWEENYPLTAGTFDPFSFDALIAGSNIGRRFRSSEAPLPPQLSVSNEQYLSHRSQKNSSVPKMFGNREMLHDIELDFATRDHTFDSSQSDNDRLERRGGLPPTIILQEPAIPNTNFANR